jgi:hypothetical protein
MDLIASESLSELEHRNGARDQCRSPMNKHRPKPHPYGSEWVIPDVGWD